MKMHFLSGGRLRMRRSVYYPGAAREETVELPVMCTLLKHNQANVLFDTGCSPDAAVNAEARWGGVARAMVPMFNPQDTVIHQLGKAGLTPDDIDVVICSHFHPDHCGCNEHFKRASILCHADELAAAQSEDGAAQGYLPVEWNHAQRGFETFDGARDLFGDGHIILYPVPGHTPGMTAALVRLHHEGEILLASDAAAVEANLVEGYAPRNSWDMDRATKSLADIKAARDRGVKVIYGHDDKQWQSLRKGAEFYS